jgi:hypothetical protein
MFAAGASGLAWKDLDGNPMKKSTRKYTANLQPSQKSRLRTWLGSQPFAWIASLGLHGIIFLALCATVFREEPEPRRNIIPEARLGDTAGNQFTRTSVPLKLKQYRQDEAKWETSNSLSEVPQAEITLDEPVLTSMGGVVTTESAASLTAQTLSSVMDDGPVTSLFGQSGNAHRVVYVVDVSASLLIYIENIIHEMHRSIRSLLPTQKFHIVLAKPREVVEFKPRRLVPGLHRYKQMAVNFIDTIDGIPQPGKADPIEAMKRAFACQPELIYFLTDGDYPELRKELQKTLQQLNAEERVKITVIGFDPAPKSKALLTQIAEQHGGHYRFVESVP